MEQRFAVLAEGATPKIYKVPVNKTARLINEFPFQHVEIFKTLNDANIAALGFARNAQPNQNSKISISDPRPQTQIEELRNALSQLTENHVETYYF